MDSTAIFEQQLTVEQAFHEMKTLSLKVKSVNGLMITIAHNNYLGSDPKFQDWKKNYGSFLLEMKRLISDS
jgi:hypothetical protein